MNRREVFAISAALLALVLGVAVLILLHWHLKTPDSVAFIAVLILPFLIYIMASGRLLEFSGPGGWGAKFQTHAQNSVEFTGILEDAEPVQALAKGCSQELSHLVAELDRRSPCALVLEVGRPNYYQIEAIRCYLKALIAIGAPAYVVFVDSKSKKFIGSASANQLVAYLEDHGGAEEFIGKLEGQPRLFAGYGFLVTDALTPDDTNVTALQKFVSTHADALVIISEDRRKPIGVLDRDRLMTKLMLKLAS
jgi:hypothetical protein